MKEFTAENFEQEVLTTSVPVLVDFFAEWCGPCKLLTPVLEKLAEEYANTGLIIGKVNCETAHDLTLKYSISSIPCMIIFKGGKEVKKITGLVPESTLRAAINDVGF